MQALPTLALMLTAVACRIKAQNLSRGEGSNYAGLRSAWSSPLSVWAHSTGSVVSSQAPFRVVPPDGFLSTHFYQDLDMAPGSRFLSIWTSHGCYLVHLRARNGSALTWRVLVYRSQCIIATQHRVNLWKRMSRVTRVTLVLWIGNQTLRLLPNSSRCWPRPFRQRNLRSR